ncbi:DUF3486 family protein [Marinomonas sp. RS-M-Aa-14]|uniref:DUF3486 family protein n=1 Tax=Marinomonas sp. RS-M-Aa-14 TaxID=3241169 RepID=UPI00390C4214
MLKRAKNRKSKVELLPEEIRASIGALIRSGDMTQKDILAAINEMIDEAGLPEDAKISRTSFNRYAQRMEKNGERIRDARAMAEVWVTKFGEAPVSEVGKLLQEFIRTMAFETSMSMMDEASDGGKPIPPKALGQLALVVQRIESAAMMSTKVEKEIRKAFAEQAASEVEAVVKKAGISADTAADIKKHILGIA